MDTRDALIASALLSLIVVSSGLAYAVHNLSMTKAALPGSGGFGNCSPGVTAAYGYACSPTEAVGPCTWLISLDGTKPVAEAMVGGLSVSPGDNLVGTAGQDLSSFIQSNVVFSAKQNLCLANTVFTLTTTWTIPPNTEIVGGGSGQLWNQAEPGVTELKCSLSSNNVPCIKISDATLAEGVTMRDIKLFYTGSAAGTNGISIDGVTSVARRIDFYNVNIQSFTGYCLESDGTTSDIHYYSLGAMSCSLGGVLVDPKSGIPSQHYFYAPTIIENVASKWAMNITSASESAIFGGTIANGVSGGNGLFFKGIAGVGIYNVNIEGASVANSTGVLYTGTGMRLEGGNLHAWATGLEVGPSPTGVTSATNWFVDTNFGSNTADVLITAGGSRNGILGPVSTATLSSITNNRATSDGVYTDLLKEYMPSQQPSPITIAVGASPFVYQNQLFYDVDVWISGGTVSNVTITQSVGAGKQIASTTNISAILLPGWKLYVTYSSIPTMQEAYSGP